MIVQSLRLALKALAANKLRALLTLLGVVIGVGAVVALLSIGSGAGEAITGQIEGLGANLIIVFPGAIERNSIQSAIGSAPTLTENDAIALADPRHNPSVTEVAPVLIFPAQVIRGPVNIRTSIRGSAANYGRVRDFTLARGRFLEQADLDSAARVAVIGDRVARDLFEGLDPLGEIVRIDRVPVRVVGVLAPRGASLFGTSEDDMIILPLTTAQTRIQSVRSAAGDKRLVSTLLVAIRPEADIDWAVGEVTYTLRQTHRLAPGAKDDFTVVTQRDLLGVFDQVTSILTLFLGAIAGISLLVGGIGIMNIMLVSVTERTREIGLRKAVGARRRDILAQFLIEAMMLSTLGGLIGVGLGVGVAEGVRATGVFEPVVTAWSVLLSVTFALAVGLFFGLYPAVRAAQLNPIDALRYE